MFNSQINQSHSFHNLFTLQKPFLARDLDATHHSSSSAYSPTTILLLPTTTKKFNATHSRSTRPTSAGGKIKAIKNPLLANITKVSGVIHTKSTYLFSVTPSRVLDDALSFVWTYVLLEFVSKDLDSKGEPKRVKTKAPYDTFGGQYTFHFDVPDDFGEIGAVLVENDYRNKIYIQKIELSDKVTFTCNSWVHSSRDNPQRRIFFADKCYLPSETPEALKSLRKKDLEFIRGTGEGERKAFERIYDYDVYNDLGDPDNKKSDLARPVLGGKKFPYPRRCRTGRKMSSTDPLTETRSSDPFYVPIDEDFSEIKSVSFGARTLYNLLLSVIPRIGTALIGKDEDFLLFEDIDQLFDEGVLINGSDKEAASVLPRIIHEVADAPDDLIKFDPPETVRRDTFFWLRDDEFSRQMLAGLNPCSLQLVTEWPLMSKLDPKVYGPPESAITKEIVEREIKGFMTFDEALAQKKLFMLDYHDLLLPYVSKTRDLEGVTLYGSRTLMFLTPAGTLTPVAIELTRPSSEWQPQWKHVYTPSLGATGSWLWKLAKAHVLSHDSGVHQLVSHWLRTHCAIEPYIIATHRNLSQIHPIARLLHPHFRYTLKINALARQSLINAGGIIESTFSPGKYCMQLCSDAYDLLWRFDHEALPADLISRGMAVEDETAPHGLKLTIEDYPYANDGLILWDAIKQWVTSFVNNYYPKASLVESDEELQAWWNEIRTVGHGDKKDESWWPHLKTQDDLIGIVSTIIWVASGLHSAVNFGQYDFAGYFPNRPTIARTKMPNDDPTDKEWQAFLNRPEDALLKCFPSKKQATIVMAILDVLSTHSTDEEYIGKTVEGPFEAEPAIKKAYEEFRARINEMELIIDSRNADHNLRNRSGAGLVPYQLLKPFSEAGVTGKGVPNSVSI
ncbi:lipoxygenase 2, chloroplastic [Lactuca sativa]|uniref:Lipoxygenase n=1 Tax=Lactuca sativa TaxID=4236 RepID=A0A9R1WTB0_LACSA|nr:lipoxygenase 2, chloroplastic [Lactuca sativa]KAJ0228386.1 hypothetical protein LSAT_V11C100022210 [Lactuca sativa]